MRVDPLVSVIVPPYNSAATLDATLASAQAQSYGNIEVIVADEGSTDATFQISQGWAEKDSRFKAMRNPVNSGVSAARNTAIRASHGEWLAFLDADDVWFPDKLKLQMELSRQDPQANLLFANYWLWDGLRDIELRYTSRRKMPDGNPTHLTRWNLFGLSSVVVRRETVEQVGFFDPTIPGAEDWDLWLRLAERHLWARGVWEPQLRYRVSPGSASADKVRLARRVVMVLERAFGRPQTPTRRRLYRRSLGAARADLELAQARLVIEQDPAAVAGAVWRAWRHSPSQLKWLLRYFALVWPVALGGRTAAQSVYRRLKAKW